MKPTKIWKWLVVNLVLSYLLAEIILWFLDLPKEYQTHSQPPQFQRVDNEEILYVNLPNHQIAFVYDGNPRGYFQANNTVMHRTNQYGFRGDDFSLETNDNTRRIVFLGDSFTFGEGVYDQDTYPEQFKRLAEQEKLWGKKSVEVINLAVGGYNTWQEWALLRDFAAKLEPDLVVIGYTINDAEPYLFMPLGQSMVRRNREALVPENPSPTAEAPLLIKLSRLHRLLWHLYQNRKRSGALIDYYQSLYQENQDSWLESKQAIANIGRYAESHTVPVVAVIFPLLHRLDRYPFVNIHQKVMREFEQNRIAVIDLLPLLAVKKTEDLWVHPTDHHPNEIVHRLAAESLLKHLDNSTSGAE